MAAAAKNEDRVVLEAAGREVAITHPGKVFFPERGETKLDLATYYLAVEEPLMAAVRDRPVMLQRYPEGAGGPSFFQKRVPASRPDWLQTSVVATPNGTTSEALVAADVAHLLWAVNLGCLGFHVWPTTAGDPEHADELRIDLDPGPGVTFPMVREAAAEVRDLLDELGAPGRAKTTGNRGIHVYVRLQPRWTSYEVRAAAVAVARELERRRPDLCTAAWWKEERGERVFIDLIRTHRTRRSSGPGPSGVASAVRFRRPSGGTSSRPSNPTPARWSRSPNGSAPTATRGPTSGPSPARSSPSWRAARPTWPPG
jgi:DNA ligase D-like protein (predicted polymerase)